MKALLLLALSSLTFANKLDFFEMIQSEEEKAFADQTLTYKPLANNL
jgi:hypothetical protein